MDDRTRGNGPGSLRPNARPSHPATVVQPKVPHPATVVQPKVPHPATVVQPKGPHPATILQPKLHFPHAATLLHPTTPPTIQRRGYTNLDIDGFITNNPRLHAETDSAYLARLTALFKTQMQYGDRDDLRYLRKTMMGHRSLLVSTHGNTRTLSVHFDAHVLGNQAGVGWHTERNNANGNPGYSYTNRGWIAQSKGTYWGDNIIVAGTAKAGNNGVSSFYPATMTIAEIRAEALYVANTNAPAGQLIIGRGRKTGIMIECLMNGNTITSAYPFKP